MEKIISMCSFRPKSSTVIDLSVAKLDLCLLLYSKMIQYFGVLVLS